MKHYSGANKFKRGHILRRISGYYFKLKEKEMRFYVGLFLFKLININLIKKQKTSQ